MNYTLLFLSFFFFFLTQAQSNERVAKNLAILELADSLLGAPENWTQVGDFKVCSNEQQYTLQCALIQASLLVNDKYKHRGLASRTLRRSIMQQASNKFKHPIYEFNQLETSSFLDVKEILNQAIIKLKN